MHGNYGVVKYRIKDMVKGKWLVGNVNAGLWQGTPAWKSETLHTHPPAWPPHLDLHILSALLHKGHTTSYIGTEHWHIKPHNIPLFWSPAAYTVSLITAGGMHPSLWLSPKTIATLSHRVEGSSGGHSALRVGYKMKLWDKPVTHHNHKTSVTMHTDRHLAC